MEFFDLIKARRSIRAFTKKEVEEEKIKHILEAANRSPSAGNLQAYEIVVVKDKARKKQLADAALGQSPVAEVPVVLIFLASPNRSSAKYGKRGEELYCILDAAIATSYAQLAVTDLGLGCVWIGAFDDEKVKKIIKAPEYLHPVAILPIGYPAEKPMPTPRRRIEDLVHEEQL